MAIKQVRIGSNPDAFQYDDADFTTSMEADDPIRVNSAPINVADVLRLEDISTLGILTSTAVIVDNTIVRGDGGDRGVQDSGITIDDSDNLTLPAGAVISSANSDLSHILGRAVIGYIGTGNEAALQHRALALDGTNYAIQQTNAGTCYVNCAATKELHFCRNDVSLATLTELESLVDNSMVDTLHRHSELSASDGTPDGSVQITAAGVTNIGDGGTTNYASFADDGEITLHGTARVTNHQTISLSAMKRGVGSPPGEGLVDGFPTLDFASGADEEVFFSFHTPSRYDGTMDMAIHLAFFVDTAPVAAAGVYFAVEWKVIAEGAAVDFSAGTATVGHLHAITTGTPANDEVLMEDIQIEGGAGAIASDSLILCRLYRDVSNAGDTFAGDVRLIATHVHYVSNKLGHST